MTRENGDRIVALGRFGSYTSTVGLQRSQVSGKRGFATLLVLSTNLLRRLACLHDHRRRIAKLASQQLILSVHFYEQRTDAEIVIVVFRTESNKPGMLATVFSLKWLNSSDWVSLRILETCVNLCSHSFKWLFTLLWRAVPCKAQPVKSDNAL